MKQLYYVLCIVLCIFVMTNLYKLYSQYYSYSSDFKETALELGYTQLMYHAEYYQIYEAKGRYLVLIKGNSNHYVVHKSEGLSVVDLIKLGTIESNSKNSLYLVPSSKLVGNSRVKHLEGYLSWRFINEVGEVIFIDFFVEK